MISITADPANPDKLILTAAVTLYLDRLLVATLNSEIKAAIHQQAAKDLKSNRAVKKEIAAASTRLLLGMLGAATGAEETKSEIKTKAEPV